MHMTSTLAAEMRALFQLIQEIIFVIGLCKELVRPLHLPDFILEDNKNTIFLATQEAMRLKRAKTLRRGFLLQTRFYSRPCTYSVILKLSLQLQQ